MPILTWIFFTFNWLTLTSEMHFVKFHPEVASCLLSRGKRKYAPLGMRLLWKYINYFLVYHLISHFLLYLQNYKEFEAEILDLQSEKYWLSFDIKKYTTSGWALGDENVIGIRTFEVDNGLSASRPKPKRAGNGLGGLDVIRALPQREWENSFCLTAHNWQKWKRVFLTCLCHKIYRDKAVGLKSCKYTWKITIFVKMWNLGQYHENLIFCQ